MATTQPRSILYSQNFLHSPKLVDRLIDRANVNSSDDVLEIGPGRGIITERLARRCRRVVAIEKDRRLIGPLRQRLADHPNVEVRRGDFLDFTLPCQPYKVFASIPFNITTAIVGKLTSGLSPPDDAYLVVQREAAHRFVGTPRETLTSVLLDPWFDISVVYHFRRTDFDPVPNVGIVLIRLRRRAPPGVEAERSQLFRDFVSFCFTAWQPSVGCSLKAVLGRRQAVALLRRVSLPWDTRPSEVCSDQWLALFQRIADEVNPRLFQRVAGAEDRWRRQQATIDKIYRSRVPRTS